MLTVVDVYLLARVVSISRQIRLLTGRILPAAVGIVHNTTAGEALGRTVQLVTALVQKTGAADPLTAAVVRKLQGQE